jgi:hypothetical protein
LVIRLNGYGRFIFILIKGPDLVQIDCEELVLVQRHSRESDYNPLLRNPPPRPSSLWTKNETETRSASLGGAMFEINTALAGRRRHRLEIRVAHRRRHQQAALREDALC